MRALLLITCILSVACNDQSDVAGRPTHEKHRQAQAFERHQQLADKEIEYHKDGRTGLCFAVLDAAGGWGTVSNVPCTDKVEALIKEQGQ